MRVFSSTRFISSPSGLRRSFLGVTFRSLRVDESHSTLWPLEICRYNKSKLWEIESNSVVNHVRRSFADLETNFTMTLWVYRKQKDFLRPSWCLFSHRKVASHNKHVYTICLTTRNLRCSIRYVQLHRHFSSEFYCFDESECSCCEAFFGISCLQNPVETLCKAVQATKCLSRRQFVSQDLWLNGWPSWRG
jgi:hypothetical protein